MRRLGVEANVFRAQQQYCYMLLQCAQVSNKLLLHCGGGGDGGLSSWRVPAVVW